MEIGLGLWTMQSTALDPVNHAAAYRSLVDDALHAEAAGFAALWVAEHRFWYDGWCPAPLVAAAAIAAATTRLRVGTGMLLLPMHDPGAVAASTAQLDVLSAGRIDLGVGLGYRDEEFDGLGLRRTRRGALMEAHLDGLLAAWDARGDLVQQPHPPVWMGGMAPAALSRGARRGLHFLLPPTLSVSQVEAAVARIQDAADAAGMPRGRIGMVKDTWVEEDGERARNHLHPWLTRGTREYGRGWWVFKDELTGSERPDLVEAQVGRAHDAAIVGSPNEVVTQVRELGRAGVDLLCLHVHRAASRHHARAAIELLASEVLPAVHQEVADVV